MKRIRFLITLDLTLFNYYHDLYRFVNKTINNKKFLYFKVKKQIDIKNNGNILFLKSELNDDANLDNVLLEESVNAYCDILEKLYELGSIQEKSYLYRDSPYDLDSIMYYKFKKKYLNLLNYIIFIFKTNTQIKQIINDNPDVVDKALGYCFYLFNYDVRCKSVSLKVSTFRG